MTAQATSTAPDTKDLLVALSQTEPVAYDSLPKDNLNRQVPGTFWSFQHPEWPPLPGNVLGLDAWPLGDGVYVLDDRAVDYSALKAAAELERSFFTTEGSSLTMMAMNLSATYAYGNPVYLTNLTATVANGITAAFGIAGGTNFVPYDILTTTNLATPKTDWNWIGIGYTSNRYTFSNQPSAQAFYLLAKPARTMVVGWGGNIYGQCDVPLGTNKLLMVAGGYGYNLGVLTNGTVIGWGNSTAAGWVPSNLVGNVSMVCAAWDHNVALLTNGTVQAWGFNAPALGYPLTEVPPDLTNAIVISAQALHTLALRQDGTVVAWGYNYFGQTNVPAGLANVTAIAAGGNHSLAVSNGYVVAWGNNSYGQCTVPANLSNVWDVAASDYHSLALRKDGTVAAWGDNAYGESAVPAGLSNVVAIAAGGSPNVNDTYMGHPLPYSLALKQDGTVAAWGAGVLGQSVQGLENVIGISGGLFHALAVRTGPPTPVITLAPTNWFQVAGGSVSFTAKGRGLYGVSYQWQTNGVNLPGETNTTLILTNVQAAQEGSYQVLVTDNGGMGSITSSNATLTLVTAPVILSQSPSQTNLNFGVAYQTNVTLGVTAAAPGMTNGYPLSYQWRANGISIPGATLATYNFNAVAPSTNLYSVVVSNLAGSVTSFVWQVTAEYAINVTNDLLLIYNTNSAASTELKDYYLAHRPMVSGANVLGVGCDVGEFTTSTNCDEQIVYPVLNWLTNNPTKRPQYIILFYDIPTRLTNLSASTVPTSYDYGSVGYHLHILRSDWQPFVNYINGGTLVDCKAYVDKLEFFGTNYAPGQLTISGGSTGYGNTNYVLDGIRHGAGYPGFENYTAYGDRVAQITNGLIAVGVPTASVYFSDGTETITNGIPSNLPHLTSATNVAGYICWGGHSSLGAGYAIDGTLQWKGNSSWWIIRTLESYNGQKADPGQGNFVKWFSSNAFGGTNYSNTPIGASSNVEEPGLESSTTTSAYFSSWASGKNFGVCVWNARNTVFFQAVGDPFVTR